MKKTYKLKILISYKKFQKIKYMYRWKYHSKNYIIIKKWLSFIHRKKILNILINVNNRIKIGSSHGKWRRFSIKSERNVFIRIILFKSKMNVRLLIFALILCFIFFIAPRGTFGYLWPKRNTYMTRWDKVNLNEILDSKRLLQHYFNCLMSKGPCPPDGMELKSEFFH